MYTTTYNFLFLFSFLTYSKDLSVVGITKPNDGCSLSNDEKISVIIGNSSKSDFIFGSQYTISYTINNGVAVTQNGVNFINSTSNTVNFLYLLIYQPMVL